MTIKGNWCTYTCLPLCQHSEIRSRKKGGKKFISFYEHFFYVVTENGGGWVCSALCVCRTYSWIVPGAWVWIINLFSLLSLDFFFLPRSAPIKTRKVNWGRQKNMQVKYTHRHLAVKSSCCRRRARTQLEIVVHLDVDFMQPGLMNKWAYSGFRYA
jgi:hypothetical protein